MDNKMRKKGLTALLLKRVDVVCAIFFVLVMFAILFFPSSHFKSLHVGMLAIAVDGYPGQTIEHAEVLSSENVMLYVYTLGDISFRSQIIALYGDCLEALVFKKGRHCTFNVEPGLPLPP